MIGRKYPIDLQTAILFEHYDIYKQTLPPLAGSQAQSFQCGRQKGTIFFFEYANAVDREHAERFIRHPLWGEDHPHTEDPELIEHSNNVLLIISFTKVPNVVLAAVRAKLTNKEAQSQPKA